MKRRSLLLGSSAAAAGIVLQSKMANAADTDWSVQFESNLKSNTWPTAYAGLHTDLTPLSLSIQGKIPKSLNGALYRNGPARFEIGGHRYHHWFDGDGMIQKYSIDDQVVSHQARFVRTTKFEVDSKAGEPVTPVFGTSLPNAEPPSGPDDMNVANTSIMLNGDGELMALWEGGSAYRLTKDLETLGPKEWSREYAGMPFSAHPKKDKEGFVWNFGVSSWAGLLTIYCIERDGSLKFAKSVSIPQLAMIHDFAVTENYLVFLLPPFIYDKERAKNGETVLGSHVWMPSVGLRAMVLKKNDLEHPIWFDLPTGFVFHIANAWEERSKRNIHLDFVVGPDPKSATEILGDVMRGVYSEREPISSYARATLDLQNGVAKQTNLPYEIEFPQIDGRYSGVRNKFAFAAARINVGARPGFNSIVAINNDTGRTQYYRFDDEIMLEEHVFVPNKNYATESDGWLIGSALDLKNKSTMMLVFRASSLADGPIAIGRMDRTVPIGLHALHVSKL